MSRKTQIQPFLVIEGGDMSLASIASKSTHVKQTDVVELIASWSGAQATNGDLLIEASLDGENWYALDFGVTISLDGVSGNHQMIIQQVSFSDIRTTYNRTNGSASGDLSLQLFATTKGA